MFTKLGQITKTVQLVKREVLISFLTDMDRDSDGNDSSTDYNSSSNSGSAAPKWLRHVNRVVSSSLSEENETESAKVTPTAGEAV